MSDLSSGIRTSHGTCSLSVSDGRTPMCQLDPLATPPPPGNLPLSSSVAWYCSSSSMVFASIQWLYPCQIYQAV